MVVARHAVMVSSPPRASEHECGIGRRRPDQTSQQMTNLWNGKRSWTQNRRQWLASSHNRGQREMAVLPQSEETPEKWEEEKERHLQPWSRKQCQEEMHQQ